MRTGAEPFFFLQLDPVQFAQAPRSRFWVTRQTESSLAAFKQMARDRVGKHIAFIDISAIINLVTDVSTKIITIIISCMSIIIVLILLVSIASNEASAMVSQKTYRLYHIIGMTKSQLYAISWRIGLLYAMGVVFILALTVPISLWMIYRSASILIRSWASVLPLGIGIIITLSVMIISYR